MPLTGEYEPSAWEMVRDQVELYESSGGTEGLENPGGGPVIILTTSGSDRDVLNSYRLHANGYITKPVTADTFIEVIKQIDHFFGSVARLPPITQ